MFSNGLNQYRLLQEPVVGCRVAGRERTQENDQERNRKSFDDGFSAPAAKILNRVPGRRDQVPVDGRPAWLTRRVWKRLAWPLAC